MTKLRYHADLKGSAGWWGDITRPAWTAPFVRFPPERGWFWMFSPATMEVFLATRTLELSSLGPSRSPELYGLHAINREQVTRNQLFTLKAIPPYVFESTPTHTQKKTTPWAGQWLFLIAKYLTLHIKPQTQKHFLRGYGWIPGVLLHLVSMCMHFVHLYEYK